jgi:hypothetical protein
MDILVSIDGALALRLERVAPAKSRKRSDFIRMALRKAILEAEEIQTRAAYLRDPDTAVPLFDPAAWSDEPWTERQRKNVTVTRRFKRKAKRG